MEKGVTNSPTLPQFFSIGETEGFFLDVAKKKERKSGMKKKPVTDLFSRKKESSTNGFFLYSSSHLQWNCVWYNIFYGSYCSLCFCSLPFVALML